MEGGVSSFVDTSKSVGLTDAPQPGSVSQTVFMGELCDRECAELDHTGRTTVTEQNSSILFLVWCVTVSGPSRKILTLDRITVVITSCLTSFVPNWNRSAVIRYSLFMVMASCLTVSVPSRRKAGECTQRRRI